MTWQEPKLTASHWEEDGEITLHMHFDQHGSWLQVPHLMMIMLDFRPSEFSRLSYVDDKYIYLDEDVDANKFLQRFEYVNECLPSIIAHDYGEEAVRIRELQPNSMGRKVSLH